MKKNRNEPIRTKEQKGSSSSKELTPGPGTRYYEKRKGLPAEGKK